MREDWFPRWLFSPSGRVAGKRRAGGAVFSHLPKFSQEETASSQRLDLILLFLPSFEMSRTWSPRMCSGLASWHAPDGDTWSSLSTHSPLWLPSPQQPAKGSESASPEQTRPLLASSASRLAILAWPQSRGTWFPGTHLPGTQLRAWSQAVAPSDFPGRKAKVEVMGQHPH